MNGHCSLTNNSRPRARWSLWTKPQISLKSADSGTLDTGTRPRKPARLAGRQIRHRIAQVRSRTEPWHPQARETGTGRRTQTQPGVVQVPAVSLQEETPEAPAAIAGGRQTFDRRSCVRTAESKLPTGAPATPVAFRRRSSVRLVCSQT